MTQTTRLSSRGQVVIPAWARRKLSLEPGDEVGIELLGRDGVIVLRTSRRAEMERQLQAEFEWLERRGVSLVKEHHESRRKARIQETRRRRP